MVEKRKTFKELEQGMGLAKDEAQGSMVLRMSPPPPTEAKPAKPASLFEGKAEKALEVPGPITPTKIIDDAGIFDDGIVWEDDAGVFDFVGEDHDEMEAMVAGTPIRIKKTKPESKEALDLIKAFEEGFKGSSTGLALFKEEPKQRQMVFAEEVAATMGHMLGEAPPAAIGFMVGGGPVLGMGGAFALSTATNKVLRQSIQDVNKEMSAYYEGSATPFAFNASEWWGKFNDVLKESSKSYGAGVMAGAAGTVIGTAAEVAGASSIVKNLATITGETVAMVQTQAVLDGRTPENKEYALAAIPMAAAKVALKTMGSLKEAIDADTLATTIKELKEIVAEEGIRPFDVRFNEHFKKHLEPLLNERGSIDFNKIPKEDLDALFEENRKNPDPEWQQAISANDMFNRAEAEKAKTLAEHVEKFKRAAKRNLVDRSGNLKDEFIKEFGPDVSKDFIQNFVLSAGHGGAVAVKVAKHKERIDKGLSRKEMLWLDKFIASRRTMEILSNNRAAIERLYKKLEDTGEALRVVKESIVKPYEAKIKPLNDTITRLEKAILKINAKIAADRKGERGQAFKEDITVRGRLNKELEKKQKEVDEIGKEKKKELEEKGGPLDKELTKIKEKIIEHRGFISSEKLSLEDYLALMKKMNLAPKVTAKLKARADKYAEAMREELTDLLSEGLIDGDAYTAIAKKGEFYSLRDYIEKIDPDDKIMIGGSKRDIRGSGLHKLGEGAEKLLENDHVKLLEEVVTRTQRQILNNRAAQSLYDLAVVVKDQAKNPKSKIIKNLVTLAKEGEDPPPGYVELYAMVEGKREPLWIREELAKEYLDKIDADFQKQLNWIGWMSGAKMLKLTATGANPAFAITSIMRDTFYSAGFYEGYSGTFFKAIPELLTDMVQVFPDVIAKEGRYIEAARDGMLQNMLTAEGRVEGLKGPLDKAQTVMGYLSQLTEDLIRFSVRERGIKNGLSPKEASFDARNLLDFHQHGKTVKVLDAGIPYLNAAIQGTRGMMRYAKNNPGKFIWKMTELGVASGLLYKWNTQGVGSSQCYDSISAAEKSKFFIFCTPMAPKKDKDGNDRYAYFRIPKDQGQQIFTPLFDFLAAQTVPDRKWDSDTLWEAFLGGLPVSDTSFSPPINNMFEAFQNHSTFFRSDIWRGPEVERYQEYNKRTHPLSIMIGDLTAGVDEETGKKVGGISPARLEAGISTIIAQNNPAPKLLAYFMKKALDENDEMSNEDVYNKYFPGLPRVVKFTRPGSRGSDKKIDSVIRQENTQKKINNEALEEAYKKEGVSGALKTIMDLSKEMPNTKKESKRLHRRLEEHQAQETTPLPNKGWWYRLKRIRSVESKAKIYYDEWKKLTPEKQKELDRIRALRFPITSQDDIKTFNYAFMKLKNQQSKQGKGQ